MALAVGDGSEGDGAGDVGGAVDVLCAAIEQQQTFGTQGCIGVVGGLVMDDGTVGLIGGDGVEREALIEGLLGAQGGELAVDAHLGLTTGGYGGFQPAQEAHEGHAVANHGLPKATLLGIVLDGFHGQNGGRRIDN